MRKATRVWGLFYFGCLAAAAALLAEPGVAWAEDATVDSLVVNGAGVLNGQLSIQPHTPTMPTNGLIVYYNFDTDPGSTVVDASGHGNNGTVYGAVWTNAGRVGGAMFFDGGNDYIGTTFCPVTGSKARTSAVWIYYIGYSDRYVLDWGSNATSAQWGLWIDPLAKPTLWGWGDDLQGHMFLGYSAWHHIAATYDGTNRVLYLDGAIENRGVATLNTGTTYNLQLGRGPSGNYFPGRIDEVRIYDRALSAEEVRDVYLCAMPAPSNPGGLSVGSGIEQTGGSATNRFEGKARFSQGITYVAPAGDVSMGIYTNGAGN